MTRNRPKLQGSAVASVRRTGVLQPNGDHSIAVGGGALVVAVTLGLSFNVLGMCSAYPPTHITHNNNMTGFVLHWINTSV